MCGTQCVFSFCMWMDFQEQKRSALSFRFHYKDTTTFLILQAFSQLFFQNNNYYLLIYLLLTFRQHCFLKSGVI